MHQKRNQQQKKYHNSSEYARNGPDSAAHVRAHRILIMVATVGWVSATLIETDTICVLEPEVSRTPGAD